MGKSVYIVGPTSSGKTNLAIQIAKKFRGELVNADSIQVYKGLDIISGKDLPLNLHYKEVSISLSSKYSFGYYSFDSTKVYLLDLVEPSYQFNVSDFIICSDAAIDYLDSRGKLPIVVGGTYYYIKSQIDGINTLHIPPDFTLRRKLRDASIGQLQEILEEKDPIRLSVMNNSDKNNSRRLIRAIEVATTKDSFSISPRSIKKRDILLIGLDLGRELLRNKIDQRVEERMKNGAIKEIDRLYKNFDNLSSHVKNANGYFQLFSYLKGEFSLEDAIQLWKYSEYQTSKKQNTFLKKDSRIHWIDPLSKSSLEMMYSKIESFLNGK